MTKKKILHDPWLVTIGGGGILLIISTAWETISSKVDILTAALTVLKTVWNSLIFLLTFKIAIWIILVIIGVIVFVFWFVSKIKKESTPDWLNYRMDFIKEWFWVWEWKFSSLDNEYMIYNLKPICKLCKCELSHKNPRSPFYGELRCPACNELYEVAHTEDKEDVKKIILNKIRNKEYKETQILTGCYPDSVRVKLY